MALEPQVINYLTHPSDPAIFKNCAFGSGVYYLAEVHSDDGVSDDRTAKKSSPKAIKQFLQTKTTDLEESVRAWLHCNYVDFEEQGHQFDDWLCKLQYANVDNTMRVGREVVNSQSFYLLTVARPSNQAVATIKYQNEDGKLVAVALFEGKDVAIFAYKPVIIANAGRKLDSIKIYSHKAVRINSKLKLKNDLLVYAKQLELMPPSDAIIKLNTLSLFIKQNCRLSGQLSCGKIDITAGQLDSAATIDCLSSAKLSFESATVKKPIYSHDSLEMIGLECKVEASAHIHSNGELKQHIILYAQDGVASCNLYEGNYRSASFYATVYIGKRGSLVSDRGLTLGNDAKFKVNGDIKLSSCLYTDVDGKIFSTPNVKVLWKKIIDPQQPSYLRSEAATDNPLTDLRVHSYAGKQINPLLTISPVDLSYTDYSDAIDYAIRKDNSYRFHRLEFLSTSDNCNNPDLDCPNNNLAISAGISLKITGEIIARNTNIYLVSGSLFKLTGKIVNHCDLGLERYKTIIQAKDAIQSGSIVSEPSLQIITKHSVLHTGAMFSQGDVAIQTDQLMLAPASSIQAHNVVFRIKRNIRQEPDSEIRASNGVQLTADNISLHGKIIANKCIAEAFGHLHLGFNSDIRAAEQHYMATLFTKLGRLEADKVITVTAGVSFMTGICITPSFNDNSIISCALELFVPKGLPPLNLQSILVVGFNIALTIIRYAAPVTAPVIIPVQLLGNLLFRSYSIYELVTHAKDAIPKVLAGDLNRSSILKILTVAKQILLTATAAGFAAYHFGHAGLESLDDKFDLGLTDKADALDVPGLEVAGTTTNKILSHPAMQCALQSSACLAMLFAGRYSSSFVNISVFASLMPGSVDMHAIDLSAGFEVGVSHLGYSIIKLDSVCRAMLLSSAEMGVHCTAIGNSLAAIGGTSYEFADIRVRSFFGTPRTNYVITAKRLRIDDTEFFNGGSIQAQYLEIGKHGVVAVVHSNVHIGNLNNKGQFQEVFSHGQIKTLELLADARFIVDASENTIDSVSIAEDGEMITRNSHLQLHELCLNGEIEAADSIIVAEQATIGGKGEVTANDSLIALLKLTGNGKFHNSRSAVIIKIFSAVNKAAEKKMLAQKISSFKPRQTVSEHKGHTVYNFQGAKIFENQELQTIVPIEMHATRTVIRGNLNTAGSFTFSADGDVVLERPDIRAAGNISFESKTADVVDNGAQIYALGDINETAANDVINRPHVSHHHRVSISISLKHGVRIQVKSYTKVTPPTLVSVHGSIHVKANGSIDNKAARFFAHKSVSFNAEGDILFNGMPADSNSVQLSINPRKGQADVTLRHDEAVVPNYIIAGDKLEIDSHHGDVHFNAAVVEQTKKVKFHGNQVFMSRAVENHTQTQAAINFNLVSIAGIPINPHQKLTTQLKQNLPIINQLQYFQQAKSPVERAAAFWNLSLEAANMLYLLKNGMNLSSLSRHMLSQFGVIQNGCFIPTAHFSAALTISHSSYQTLSPGSIQTDDLTIEANKLVIENAYTIKAKNSKVKVDDVEIHGAALKQSHTQFSLASNVSITVTGVVTDIGVSLAASDTRQTLHVNADIDLGTFRASINTLSIHSAKIKAANMLGTIKQVTVVSERDHLDSKGIQLGANTSGKFNVGVTYSSDRVLGNGSESSMHNDGLPFVIVNNLNTLGSADTNVKAGVVLNPPNHQTLESTTRHMSFNVTAPWKTAQENTAAKHQAEALFTNADLSFNSEHTTKNTHNDLGTYSSKDEQSHLSLLIPVDVASNTSSDATPADKNNNATDSYSSDALATEDNSIGNLLALGGQSDRSIQQTNELEDTPQYLTHEDLSSAATLANSTADSVATRNEISAGSNNNITKTDANYNANQAASKTKWLNVLSAVPRGIAKGAWDTVMSTYSLTHDLAVRTVPILDIQDYVASVERMDGRAESLSALAGFVGDIVTGYVIGQIGSAYDSDTFSGHSGAVAAARQRVSTEINSLIDSFNKLTLEQQVEFISQQLTQVLGPAMASKAFAMFKRQMQFGTTEHPWLFHDKHPERTMGDVKPIPYEALENMHGRFIFVITEDGRLNIAERNNSFHNDISEGNPVILAGEFVKTKESAGTLQIEEPNNFSGHFRPYGDQLSKIFKYVFERNGFDAAQFTTLTWGQQWELESFLGEWQAKNPGANPEWMLHDLQEQYGEESLYTASATRGSDTKLLLASALLGVARVSGIESTDVVVGESFDNSHSQNGWLQLLSMINPVAAANAADFTSTGSAEPDVENYANSSFSSGATYSVAGLINDIVGVSLYDWQILNSTYSSILSSMEHSPIVEYLTREYTAGNITKHDFLKGVYEHDIYQTNILPMKERLSETSYHLHRALDSEISTETLVNRVAATDVSDPHLLANSLKQAYLEQSGLLAVLRPLKTLIPIVTAVAIMDDIRAITTADDPLDAAKHIALSSLFGAGGGAAANLLLQAGINTIKVGPLIGGKQIFSESLTALAPWVRMPALITAAAMGVYLGSQLGDNVADHVDLSQTPASLITYAYWLQHDSRVRADVLGDWQREDRVFFEVRDHWPGPEARFNSEEYGREIVFRNSLEHFRLDATRNSIATLVSNSSPIGKHFTTNQMWKIVPTTARTDLDLTTTFPAEGYLAEMLSLASRDDGIGGPYRDANVVASLLEGDGSTATQHLRDAVTEGTDFSTRWISFYKTGAEVLRAAGIGLSLYEVYKAEDHVMEVAHQGVLISSSAAGAALGGVAAAVACGPGTPLCAIPFILISSVSTTAASDRVWHMATDGSTGSLDYLKELFLRYTLDLNIASNIGNVFDANHADQNTVSDNSSAQLTPSSVSHADGYAVEATNISASNRNGNSSYSPPTDSKVAVMPDRAEIVPSFAMNSATFFHNTGSSRRDFTSRSTLMPSAPLDVNVIINTPAY